MMSKSILALVNPNLLAWARKEAGYEVETIAARFKQPIKKILSWESGNTKPTIKQATALAKYYHRPFSVFFLSQPPAIPPLSSEYRHLPGVVPGVESPELRLALRTMSQRRELTISLSNELGVPVERFATRVSLREQPSEAGKKIRDALGVTDSEQLSWKSNWQAWRHWREAVENIGVLVFQFPKVSLEQARGVSLLHENLPVIGVNSKEIFPGARSFTLMHELVHIALAQGQEEAVAQNEKRDEETWGDVEKFAEETASHVLIPDDLLNQFLGRMSVSRDSWDVSVVRKLAGSFRITPLAMATRLRSIGAFSWAGYTQWKNKWNEYLAGLKAPKKKGFATPTSKTLSRGGWKFSQLVLEALDANRITSVDASRYLDLKFNHFETLRDTLRKYPDDNLIPADNGE